MLDRYLVDVVQAPAKKTAVKKAPLAPKRTPNDSISEDEEPVLPVNEAMETDEAEEGTKAVTKTKSASEMYTKVSFCQTELTSVVSIGTRS